jgi:hypothetical protein
MNRDIAQKSCRRNKRLLAPSKATKVDLPAVCGKGRLYPYVPTSLAFPSSPNVLLPRSVKVTKSVEVSEKQATTNSQREERKGIINERSKLRWKERNLFGVSAVCSFLPFLHKLIRVGRRGRSREEACSKRPN